MADDNLAEPGPQRPPGPRGPRVWPAVLIAFALGLGAAGWLGWRSGADFGHLLGLPRGVAELVPVSVRPRQAAQLSAPPVAVVAPMAARPDDLVLAGRVAAIEQRLDRLSLRTEAASGNAARAEALLVAFAVRRVVERGAPLGYLADQLKLRFGDARPNAVTTIVTGAKDLVPLDQLAARLEAMAPQLTETDDRTMWNRVTRELADLFVVRRDRPMRSDAFSRFDQARRALSDRRIDDAITEVQHLSNSNEAASWTAAARHYRDVEAALDLIDNAALLEPHQLHDGAGNPVNPMMR